MPTKLSREQFLHTLESVSAGLSPRKVIEQSDSFVLRNGKVMCFNDEVFCRGPSGLPKELTGAVPAKPLTDQLQKWVEDEVEVDVADNKFIIRGKGRGAKINMEAEISLPIDAVEKPGDWSLLHKDFAEAVGIVGACASKDESHYPINCVNLTGKWIEACTRFQVCRWKMRTGLSKPILVRPSALKSIATMGMTEFSETASWLHFRNADGLQLSCRAYVEEFRDLSDLLEMPESAKATLPKGLVQACEKAQVFSKEMGDEQDMVQIELTPGRLKIKATGISGSYWETKKVNWAGDAMTFLISPTILGDIVTRHTDCSISKDKLKVNGDGRYQFVTWIGQPAKDEEDEAPEQDEAEIKERTRKARG